MVCWCQLGWSLNQSPNEKKNVRLSWHGLFMTNFVSWNYCIRIITCHYLLTRFIELKIEFININSYILLFLIKIYQNFKGNPINLSLSCHVIWHNRALHEDWAYHSVFIIVVDFLIIRFVFQIIWFVFQII